MKTILLIEDNKDLRENITEILDLAGYKVVTAHNGKVGVEKAQTENPDLIVCDVMMPVLDGFSALRILSNNSVTAGIPFIFLTAKAEKSDFRKGMSLGADDYITKPFDDNDLLSAIELRLKKHKSSPEKEEKQMDINAFFSETNEMAELKEIAGESESKSFKKKEVIFSEGNHVNGLHYISKGKVKTYKTNDDGKEFITGIHKEGDFLGYVALLENMHYTESAEALDDTTIRVVPRTDFLNLLFSNQQVSRKFIKMLSNNIKEKEERLLALAYNSVRQRVAEALLQLQKKYQDKNAAGFSITREDLANMVGTATESLIRTLSDFKEEGVVEVKGGTILIKDQGKLQRIIQF